jgi:polyribonucleotide nucleotidyltransferase
VSFLPLSVDIEERMPSAGKIPGGFLKREGRPSDRAILTARLTDRPLRPLFPKNYRNEIQVIGTVLVADQEMPYDVVSMVGASAALSLSDLPFDGPIGAVRVGRGPEDGSFILNPTYAQIEESDLDSSSRKRSFKPRPRPSRSGPPSMVNRSRKSRLRRRTRSSRRSAPSIIRP